MTSHPSIHRANPAHIASLTTLFPRAFYHVNPALYAAAFPDTPAVREHFWTPFFTRDIQTPTSHPLVAIDPTNASTVIGLISLRRLEADEPGNGGWSLQPMLPEQDAELFAPAFRGIEDWRKKIFGGTGRAHLLVQLFGVDATWRSSGVGKRLLQSACNLADAEGLDMFVQANAGAKGFYEKFGFEDMGTTSLSVEGQAPYMEHHLVRRGKGWPAEK